MTENQEQYESVKQRNVLLEDNKPLSTFFHFSGQFQFETLNVIGRRRETVKVNKVVRLWLINCPQCHP